MTCPYLIVTCPECKRFTSDLHYVSEQKTHLCKDCLEEETHQCEYCDAHIVINYGDEKTVLCKDCREYYHCDCETCGKLVHVFDIADTENGFLCSECAGF